MPTATLNKPFPTIARVETFIPAAGGDGGDYHRQKDGHWILDGGKPHADKPGVRCASRPPLLSCSRADSLSFRG